MIKIIVKGIIKLDKNDVKNPYFIVLGTGANSGQSCFLTKSFIVGSHPQNPAVKQTTIFNMDDKYKVKWQSNNPDFARQDNAIQDSAIPVPQPIPAGFGEGSSGVTQATTTTQTSTPSAQMQLGRILGAIENKLDKIMKHLNIESSSVVDPNDLPW